MRQPPNGPDLRRFGQLACPPCFLAGLPRAFVRERLASLLASTSPYLLFDNCQDEHPTTKRSLGGKLQALRVPQTESPNDSQDS